MRRPRQLAVLCLGLGSCGSATQSVHVVSEPPGAAIYVDGERVATTAATVPLDFGARGRVLLQVIHPDRLPYEQTFTPAALQQETARDGELRIDLPR